VDKPTITILPPTPPVVVCQDATEDFVNVEFTVVADTPDPITVPGSAVVVGDGISSCIRQGVQGNRKRIIAQHSLCAE
jgi:hypothetical protein